MTTANLSAPRTAAIPPNWPGHRDERGVVLVIALILLVIVSLLAVTSMRNAVSTESVAGNVRTTELATQAADIALRHCESSAIRNELRWFGDTTSDEANYDAAGFTMAHVRRAITADHWKSVANWDTPTTAVFALPSGLVGGTATYQRPPECMVESLVGTSARPTPFAFLVTARGFGPEVPAADSNRTRPTGTVVWLQSTIEVK